MSPPLSSRLCDGPDRHFWTGSCVCSWLFVPPPHSGAAGCVIQPWADSSWHSNWNHNRLSNCQECGLHTAVQDAVIPSCRSCLMHINKCYDNKLWFNCDQMILVYWNSSLLHVSEKMQFWGFLLHQIVQKHYLGEVRKLSILWLLSFFLNTSAKII